MGDVFYIVFQEDLDRDLGLIINNLPRYWKPSTHRGTTVKNKLSCILIAGSFAVMSLSIEAAGFRQLTVSYPEHKDLTVGLWYPSDQPLTDKADTEFGLPVALNSPIATTNRGLILISHGYGGWYAGHADTAAALADAGFIVAAPSHSGNTWSDMSSSIDQWALDRPQQMSRVLDHVLQHTELKAHVDPEKVGVYGFSAGGYTALGLIGGTPDLDYADQYCTDNPQEFVCTEGMIDEMRKANMHKLPNEAWGADSRIKAASVSAPGLGFSYTRASLATVKADVQLWSGELDESVPTKTNAALLATRLPQTPETHWVEKANHFAFMTVACRDAFKQDDPEEYQIVCGDADGFDRFDFHTDMHEQMVRFFENSLGINR